MPDPRFDRMIQGLQMAPSAIDPRMVGNMAGLSNPQGAFYNVQGVFGAPPPPATGFDFGMGPLGQGLVSKLLKSSGMIPVPMSQRMDWVNTGLYSARMEQQKALSRFNQEAEIQALQSRIGVSQSVATGMVGVFRDATQPGTWANMGLSLLPGAYGALDRFRSAAYGGGGEMLTRSVLGGMYTRTFGMPLSGEQAELAKTISSRLEDRFRPEIGGVRRMDWEATGGLGMAQINRMSGALARHGLMPRTVMAGDVQKVIAGETPIGMSQSEIQRIRALADKMGGGENIVQAEEMRGLLGDVNVERFQRAIKGYGEAFSGLSRMLGIAMDPQGIPRIARAIMTMTGGTAGSIAPEQLSQQVQQLDQAARMARMTPTEILGTTATIAGRMRQYGLWTSGAIPMSAEAAYGRAAALTLPGGMITPTEQGNASQDFLIRHRAGRAARVMGGVTRALQMAKDEGREEAFRGGLTREERAVLARVEGGSAADWAALSEQTGGFRGEGMGNIVSLTAKGLGISEEDATNYLSNQANAQELTATQRRGGTSWAAGARAADSEAAMMFSMGTIGSAAYKRIARRRGMSSEDLSDEILQGMTGLKFGVAQAAAGGSRSRAAAAMFRQAAGGADLSKAEVEALYGASKPALFSMFDEERLARIWDRNAGERQTQDMSKIMGEEAESAMRVNAELSKRLGIKAGPAGENLLSILKTIDPKAVRGATGISEAIGRALGAIDAEEALNQLAAMEAEREGELKGWTAKDWEKVEATRTWLEKNRLTPSQKIRRKARKAARAKREVEEAVEAGEEGAYERDMGEMEEERVKAEQEQVKEWRKRVDAPEGDKGARKELEKYEKRQAEKAEKKAEQRDDKIDRFMTWLKENLGSILAGIQEKWEGLGE